MPGDAPTSARLRYERLDEANVPVFHGLATDAHVRRYLLDGAIVPLAWAQEERRASDRLFASCGVGLWLVREAAGGPPVGFAGFRRFEEHGTAPELLYALCEPLTGRGLGTEMAQAMVARGEAAGLAPLVASVDAVNAASLHILETCGFVRVRTLPGAFGDMYILERRRAGG